MIAIGVDKKKWKMAQKKSFVVMHICASHWYQVSSIHHAFRHETKTNHAAFGVCVYRHNAWGQSSFLALLLFFHAPALAVGLEHA